MIKKFILLALLTLFIIEVLIGYFYFQQSWEKGSSIKWFTSRVNEKFIQADVMPSNVPDESQFNAHLKKLIAVTHQENINLVMLYIPIAKTKQPSLLNKRDYFKQQAAAFAISFIDTTEALSVYPDEWLYNQPFDSHLTRFGHLKISEIVLEKIAIIFDKNDSLNMKGISDNIAGPHPANVDSVNRYNQLAYRVQTNSQGFRMLYDLQPNKKSLMILGDSFTYGTGVNTFESYPNVLNRLIDDGNIINSGMPGTSIIEQLAYFNRIKNKSVIDTLIIQVLDNDVK